MDVFRNCLRIKLLMVLIFAGVSNFSSAQVYQTLRGVVTDRESQIPLFDAKVLVRFENNIDSFRETRTNASGEFELNKAWVGRN